MITSLVLVLAAASTCGAPSSLLSAPPARLAISDNFDATVWGGEQIHTKNALRVSYDGNAVGAQWLGKSGKTSVITDARPAPCGAISSATQAQQLVAYNDALALANGAPAALKPGVSWASTVKIYASQTQEIDVPVDVKVVKSDASGILLQAVGTASATLTQYGTPVTVSYQAAALYGGGWLKQAKSAAQEDVQAGPQSQTMTFAWSVQAER